MTASISVQIHFAAADVGHRHRTGPSGFTTLDIGSGLTGLNLHFGTPELVDAVIAELVALRAEMTGDSRADAIAPCLQPEAHASVPDGARVSCDRLEHHEAAAARGDRDEAAPKPLVISDSTIAAAGYFAQPGNAIDDILAAQAAEQ